MGSCGIIPVVDPVSFIAWFDLYQNRFLAGLLEGLGFRVKTVCTGHTRLDIKTITLFDHQLLEPRSILSTCVMRNYYQEDNLRTE